MFKVGDIVDHVANKYYGGKIQNIIPNSIIIIDWPNGSLTTHRAANNGLTPSINNTHNAIANPPSCIFKVGDIVDQIKGPLKKGIVKTSYISAIAYPIREKVEVEWPMLGHAFVYDSTDLIKVSQVNNAIYPNPPNLKIGDIVDYYSRGILVENNGEIIQDPNGDASIFSVQWPTGKVRLCLPIDLRLSMVITVGPQTITLPTIQNIVGNPFFNIPSNYTDEFVYSSGLAITPKSSKNQCECGAHKIKDHGHSDWCPVSPVSLKVDLIREVSCNCPSGKVGHTSWCFTQTG